MEIFGKSGYLEGAHDHGRGRVGEVDGEERVDLTEGDEIGCVAVEAD